MTGQPYPIHATLEGVPLAPWHRTSNLCRCGPIALRDVAEPPRLIWFHRDVPDPAATAEERPDANADDRMGSAIRSNVARRCDHVAPLGTTETDAAGASEE